MVAVTLNTHTPELRGPMGRYLKIFAFAIAGVVVARVLVLGLDAIGEAAERRSLRA